MFLPILATWYCLELVYASPKSIFIDTDLYSDVDDAGALLLAATHPNLSLLGVNVNYPSSFSAVTASAILSHYGSSEVPIGIKRPLNNNTFFDTWGYELGEYASKVAFHWSSGSVRWGEAEKAWDPVELYRKTLAEAEDGSVTIVSIGFLDNLSALLNSSSDVHSTLSGRELVESKVEELVIMGGGYPSGYSWNFWGSSPPLTAHVVNTWKGRLTFVGDDAGKYVLTGTSLMKSDLTSDPVRMAYIYYGYYAPRSSWDPLAVLYAAEGLGSTFELGNDYGHNFVDPEDGSNKWIFDGSDPREQFFLRLKASNETAAARLDHLFVKGAKQFARGGSSHIRFPLGADLGSCSWPHHTEL